MKTVYYIVSWHLRGHIVGIIVPQWFAYMFWGVPWWLQLAVYVAGWAAVVYVLLIAAVKLPWWQLLK